MTLPTDYANLQGWWDASQEVYANNDPVGSATDWSGNARHATHTGANRPTFKTSIINGLPVFDFDGTDDYLQIGSAAAYVTDTAYSVFAVFIADTIGTDSVNYYEDDAIIAGQDYFGVHFRSTGPKIIAYNNDGSVDGVETTIATGTAYVYHQRHESNVLYASLNGGSETSTASGTTATLGGDFYIGRNGSSGQYADFKLGELFIYSVARTTGEISALNTYLYNKWLVVASSQPLPMRISM
jgi:hypothetical protein